MTKGLPIFITGMHRSGTSLVANLLRQSGLWLGPENELLGAAPSNPDGHWEKIAIMELNDILLSEFGGGWDSVPDFPARWPETASRQRERALEIHANLARPTPWGWKDPRGSILMPFWIGLEPKAHVVICLRHPLEVAESLRQRAPMSYSLGLKLWRSYNQHLLVHVPRRQRLVVHYADFFTQPRKTLRRLTDFCGLIPSDEEVCRALSTVNPGFRHAYFKAEDLARVQVAPQTINVYAQLCEEASFNEAPAVLASPECLSSREVDLDALSYRMWLKYWRWLLQQSTPEGAKIAVISKGEDELVQIPNRTAWHFPLSSEGGYSGYHPENSADAIQELEGVRAKGADYLLVPRPSLWWLDYYADFRKHLERYFTEVATANGLARLFNLKPSRTPRK